MHFLVLAIFSIILVTSDVSSQSHRYPAEDFYHRNIDVPIDHTKSAEGKFSFYYELSTNYKFDQPTIIFVTDGQQSYGEAGKVDALAQLYQFDSTLNLVFMENRGRRYSFIDVTKPDSTADWEKVYRLLSSKQMIEDIECVRRDLFKDHPESKVYLFGRSGGGYIIQEYLAKYGKHVQRAYLQCAPNPSIMKQLGFLESKSFINTLNAVDPGLPEKLKVVMKKNVVPELSLLWMLFRIQYAAEKPDSIYLAIINDLMNGNTNSYNEYLKKGFDYSKMKNESSKYVKSMGYGTYMSPLQCDGYYLLGSRPDYIDPVYDCLRDLSAPLVELIEQKKVPPPAPPSLELFKNLETEVFFQAGAFDHITPYQVGIELGKYFKHYELFIADDNHMMMKSKSCYPPMRNAFFKYGIGSKELQDIRASMQCKEWKPQ
jgi:pimeloyl-ACP methyl ester carboxylesterase